MPEITVVAPGGGEVIGDAADRRVEILCDHDSLHATWSRFAPGREGADLHVHHEHTDLFYVLEGEFTLRLGPEGEEVRMPAGTVARMPPMVVHGFRNSSDAELRFLNFHAPGAGFASYMRDRGPISGVLRSSWILIAGSSGHSPITASAGSRPPSSGGSCWS